MKMRMRFEPSKKYSIKGREVTCVSTLEFNRGQLSGLQIATLVAADKSEFKVNRWANGDVFRVSPA